ncbi:hypothetical protein ACIPY1_15745 [Paenarthrobacter nicotinovorans]|uniref:hypothetical protein n=1 Tax=Paenarthrobacter nicotinovorans TaxID=29320 RepID=UPI00382CA22E
MGGSMYAAENETPSVVLRRQRALEAADSFGEFASEIPCGALKRTSTAGPTLTPNGRLVVTNLGPLRNNPDEPQDREVLLTLELQGRSPLTTKQLIDLLEMELVEFGPRLTASPPTLLRKLRNTSANSTILRINSIAREGWVLHCPPLQGVAVEFNDRVVMWVAKSESTLPTSITMTNLGREIRSLRNDFI